MHRTTRIALLAVALGSAFAADEQPPFRPGKNPYTPEQDIELGRQAAAQVRKQKRVIRDPLIDDYIKRVGNRLADTPEARDSGFPFTFEVIEDPTINAFALPGGPMFIQTGLLKAVDNEAQLAGVMAHEMTHVILRHGTYEAARQQRTGALFGLAGAVLGAAGGVGQIAGAGVNIAGRSVLLKFSRGAEKQADLEGELIMSQAGYNPLELARFFEKLQSDGGQRTLEFLSDHPNPGNRERYIEDEARRLPQRDYENQRDNRDLRAVQARLGR